jgi:hypothetical protein
MGPLGAFGDTSFWGGFAEVNNGIGAGSNGNGGNLGGIPADRFLKAGTFADVNRWFLGLDQGFDASALHLYAVYQHFNADVSLVDSSLKHVDDFPALL